jgi:GAF domain-containing protein
MRRRSKAGGAPVKARRRKAVKRRNAPKAVVRRSSPAVGQETQIALLTRERDEALEQLSAASEILKVIRSSPGDLKPVFEAILENATRICDAKFGTLFRFDGKLFHLAAQFNTPHELADMQRRRGPFLSTPQLEQILRSKQVSHTADDAAEAVPGNAATLGGARSTVRVPMLQDDVPVGAIIIYRQEVRPFTDRQIELLKNFAAQAVIAIENTRLLSELRQSLEQQTATSEVLSVISSSPGELEPVFNAMLENAVRICEASYGILYTYSDGTFSASAQYALPERFANFVEKRGAFRPRSESTLGLIERTKRVVDRGDILKDDPSNPAAEYGGARSFVEVPMLKDEILTGVILIYRQEVRPFTDRQIELLKNFAAQAVIAIENTRLLSELRESLEQQTATSEVLSVISSSPGELAPVFESMLANAVRICDAKFGTLFRIDNETFEPVAEFGLLPELAEFHRQRGSFQPSAGTGLHQLLRTKNVVHIADELAEPVPGPQAKFGSLRSRVSVPMLKDNVLIGALSIYRQEVRPFTDKQIALVQNFAAQAVIAIENTRLLSELRQSLEQQTATADVLRVISSSPGDLQPVFNAMLENATRICGAEFGVLFRFGEGFFHPAAQTGTPSAYAEFLEQRGPFLAIPGTIFDRIVRTKQVSHTIDDAAETVPGPAAKLGGARSTVRVPMLKNDLVVGVIVIYRQEVKPFTDKQIELVQNFAAQAVIAIENTRLLNELRQRTTDLTESLESLRTAQDRLVQTEKLASLGQLTAGIAHEIKNPLNFVNNFSAVSVELIDELREALAGAHLDAKLRTEIAEIADMLQGNLDKVVQHGKRADTIVKNMLLHSRQGSGEHRPVDINALVEESLNLAYHGARAEKQGFNITLERFFDPAAGEVDLFPQEITRVLLNLISNGFYAATKRKAEANSGDYEPILTATTKNLGNSVEIRIRDNGTGIPPGVKEKMFNPFFTTKPAGEGTGLGLSISHDIIVKQHSGSIEVDTLPGEFTEFRIVLPRGAATIAKSGEPT